MSAPQRLVAVDRQRTSDPRSPGQLDALAADFGVVMRWSPRTMLAVAVFVGSIGGLRAFGSIGAVVGFLAAATAPWWLRPIAARRRTVRSHRSLPVIAGATARFLRAGRPLDAAIGQAATMPGASADLQRAAAELQQGRASVAVLRDLWERAEGAHRLFVSALLLAEEQGGDIARCLDAVAVTLRAEIEFEQRRRSVVSQASFSGLVLALLPFGFAWFASTLLPGVVLHPGLVVAGVVLDACGVLWMWRLIGGVR